MNILDIECWSERLALLLVCITLGEDEPKADDAGEEVPDQPWLLKVVRVSAHDIQESLVVGSQQEAPVQCVAEMDEAIVRDGAYPLERRLATRGIKEHHCMIEKTLRDCQMCTIVRREAFLIFSEGRTFARGRCLRGLKKSGQMKTDQVARATKLIPKAQENTCWNARSGSVVLKRT